VHLFSPSPNSCQRITVLNADVPNCDITVIIRTRFVTFASSIRQRAPCFCDIKYYVLKIADNKIVHVDELKTV